MKQKILKLIRSDQIVFLLSNIIFSASTYIVMLFIPYVLNVKTMADFSSVYNAFILMLFILEFGISMSFLRYYKVHHETKFINSFLQLLIFLLIIIALETSIGLQVTSYFFVEKVGVNSRLFFFAIASQLSWVFARNTLLSLQKYNVILCGSFSILIIRFFSLLYLMRIEEITIDKLIGTVFFLPFIFILVFVISYNVREFIAGLYVFLVNRYKKRTLKILYIKIKHFLKFSMMTYLIGIFYVFSGRYLVVYLTENNSHQLLAELGYAMTFLGIITIASNSFRSFFVGKYNLGDVEGISAHLNSIKNNFLYYLVGSIIFSILMSLIVYLIMPGYLTYRSPLFAFILLLSNTIIFFMSLITFLSKTMNYNALELKINITRFVLVVLVIRMVFLDNPISGFVLINLVMLLPEAWFASRILKKFQVL